MLFAVGSSLTRTSYGQPIPEGKVIIHNVESIEDINKDYSVDIGLPGDARLTLRAMIQAVKGRPARTGAKPIPRPPKRLRGSGRSGSPSGRPCWPPRRSPSTPTG